MLGLDVFKARLIDFLGGEPPPRSAFPQLVRQFLRLFLEVRLFPAVSPKKRNYPPQEDAGPDEGNSPFPDGRLAPLRPAPSHHLVAQRDLPPGDRTHLLPCD